MGSGLPDGLSRAVGGALLAGAGRGKQHASDDGKDEYFFHDIKDVLVVSKDFSLLPDGHLTEKRWNFGVLPEFQRSEFRI